MRVQGSSGPVSVAEVVRWLLNYACSMFVPIQVTNSSSIRGVMSSTLLKETFRHRDDPNT